MSCLLSTSTCVDVIAVDSTECNVQHCVFQGQVELRKKLEEVRLLESRKSARLMDQDTDFARLADMAGDRKRASSHVIDVPAVQGSVLINYITNFSIRFVFEKTVHDQRF